MFSGLLWVAAVSFLSLAINNTSVAQTGGASNDPPDRAPLPYDSKDPMMCGFWEAQGDAYTKARDRNHNIDVTRQIVIENKGGEIYQNIAMKMIDSLYADPTIDRAIAGRIAKDSCGWPSTASGVAAAKAKAIADITAILKVARPNARPYTPPAR